MKGSNTRALSIKSRCAALILKSPHSRIDFFRLTMSTAEIQTRPRLCEGFAPRRLKLELITRPHALCSLQIAVAFAYSRRGSSSSQKGCTFSGALLVSLAKNRIRFYRHTKKQTSRSEMSAFLELITGFEPVTSSLPNILEVFFLVASCCTLPLQMAL